MQSPLPAAGRGEPEFYESPAQVAGDLNVSLLGTLARVEPDVVPPFAVTDLVDPGASYEAIVGRVELLCEHMPLKLLGCLGLDQDPVRFKLAANLAARLARTGRQVTIVEAELRAPAFAGDPTRREGLIDMLLYGCSYAAVARESGLLGVNLITAGSHPWSGEPIHGDEWERVLGALRKHSDLTLVTTTTGLPGPILSMLARRLDSILIAYGLDAIGRDAIRRSYLTLWDMDAPILGLVTAGPLTADHMVQPPAAAPEPAAEREPGTAAAAGTAWAQRFWDAGAAESVPGFDMDDGAEVVIRETTEVDESAASLWAAEVARLRGTGAPPIGVSPFLSETRPKLPEPPEIPAPPRAPRPVAGEPDDLAAGVVPGAAGGEGEAVGTGAGPAADEFAQSFEVAWDRLTRGVPDRGDIDGPAGPAVRSAGESAAPPQAAESEAQAAGESMPAMTSAEDAHATAAAAAGDLGSSLEEPPAGAEQGESPARPAADGWPVEETAGGFEPAPVAAEPAHEPAPEPELEMPTAFEPWAEAPAAAEPEPELPAAVEPELEMPTAFAPAPGIPSAVEPALPTWDEGAFGAPPPTPAEVAPAFPGEVPPFPEPAAAAAASHGEAQETAPGAGPIPERSLFADLLAPASATADEREVPDAIAELEHELEPPLAPGPPEPRQRPWRVLVIGGLFGICLVLFWAYKSEVIRFGPRPPRTAAVETPAPGEPRRTQTAAIPAPGGDDGGTGSPAASAPAAMAPAPSSPPEPAVRTTPPPGPTPQVAAPAPATEPAASPPARAAGAAPPDPERTTGAAAVAPGAGPFGVHVSSFRTRAKAEEDLSRYRALGFEGVIVSVDVAEKGTWLRVLLGPYPTFEEANRVMEAVRADGLSPAAQVFTIPR